METPPAHGTAPLGRSKQIPAGVERHTGYGLEAVGGIETGQGGDGAAALRDLEYRAGVTGAAVGSRPKHVAAGVKDHAADWGTPIRGIEAGQGKDRAAATGDFKDRAISSISVDAARDCGSIEVAGGVDGQIGFGIRAI